MSSKTFHILYIRIGYQRVLKHGCTTLKKNMMWGIQASIKADVTKIDGGDTQHRFVLYFQ